jgi:serine phosphatase RsbU (regulator of sigma subunit)
LTRLKNKPTDTSIQVAALNSILFKRDLPFLVQIDKYNQLLQLYNDKSLKKCVIEVNGQLSNLYNSTGDYNKALKHGLIAEKLAFKYHKDRLSGIYNIIGNTYLGLKKNKPMVEAFQKCYNYAKEFKQIKLMAYGAAGLGNYYGNIRDIKSSNNWNLKALKSFDSTEMVFAQCIIRINLATNFRNLRNYKEAQRYLSEAKKLLPKTNMNYCNILYYSEEALQEKAAHNYPASIESFNKAIHFSKIDQAKHNLSDIYLDLSKVYKLANQPTQALEALETHLLYKDSIFNEESNNQLLELEEQYKSEKKDAEIQLLTKSNALNTSELQRKSMFIWMFAGGGLLVVVLVFILWGSIRRKNKNNIILAHKNKEIEDKQQEIVSSINYAKRIQFTLLASDYLLKSNLHNYFVLFRPKDIVSGDFYWAIKTQTHFFLAVCDCTGHGVPGAFMSLLNINFLKEAITEKNLTAPGEIFDFVRARVLENLSEEGYNDGMDGVLIVFNEKTKAISYAGANKAPLLISNGEPVDLPFDKMPVGKGIKTDTFKTMNLDYKQGDTLYLFTDGYADQFGGPDEKKFKLKNLKQLLHQQSTNQLVEQKSTLESVFDNWKRDLEQLDDVCVLGFTL